VHRAYESRNIDLQAKVKVRLSEWTHTEKGAPLVQSIRVVSNAESPPDDRGHRVSRLRREAQDLGVIRHIMPSR
jgi:hypothetical protein